ncbi:hypothetical protein [Massilia sp. UBA6681]|uniref:hypothetical protein n=1 Tax=Massilia sp. UBA6681 TaxID=1946839 RepID=UPI0025C1E7C4|nr:hypothetical protein [Massilia sp. UBA6681]
MDNKELDKSRAEFEAWATAQNWVIDRDSFGDYVYSTARDGWEAYRAALARAGSAAPTAAEGPSKQHELTVWYGPMPESNGKSNFTAILMRKHGDKWDNMTDGITIDRSEYPDRVRYEADRVRYLLGELAERPFILDYDADKHSGYAAMSAAQAQPKDTTKGQE